MGAPIGLRSDYDGAALRALAKASNDAKQTRRLLALAVIYDGDSRGTAAQLGGVGRQIIRDWVIRFNAEGPEGLRDRKAPGKTPLLTRDQRAALVEAVEAGPRFWRDGVVRWRLCDLVQWLWEEFGVSVSRQTLGRELRRMGYTKLSARPQHHGQDPEDIAAFKKNFAAKLAAIRQTLPPGTPIELWFQDEARVGQKTALTRRWARRGTRPRAPKDQRTRSAYIFGAICPAAGKGAALVLPKCDTQAMQWHLDEIASQVAPGAHAVILLDQAGWHLTDRLNVPTNITLLALPPRAPELNPVENIWQFLRENWLSNKIFKSYNDILDHCCFAWKRLVDQPWLIYSIGHRSWAHGS